MALNGLPLELAAYKGECITNRHFQHMDLPELERFYLPRSMTCLVDDAPAAFKHFIEDDNRGAILPDPIATLDGKGFYMSVKGIGSAIDPFSDAPLGRHLVTELVRDEDVRGRFQRSEPVGQERMITGELWLRGSPYGGQGLEHASKAMEVSEMADLTSINGFLIAPLVKIVLLPHELEDRIKQIHWYRRFRGRIVQEIRLIPSNIRVYFHARNTLGTNISHIFDLFGVDSNGKAYSFETNFVRSAVAMLTAFARTMRLDKATGKYVGLDFLDVWMDKDAVLSPDGSIYFVDLEGVEAVPVERDGVKEKIEDQIYRSLYEFMFAYEQIETERGRRFGGSGNRKMHFQRVLEESLREDRFIELLDSGGSLEMVVKNAFSDEPLYLRFPLLDR
jgi:hypothetical protein